MLTFNRTTGLSPRLALWLVFAAIIGVAGYASMSAHTVVTLVGAYGFTEGAGTTALDVSGNGNSGTLVNGATWATGKFGKGLSLDGVNDRMSVPDSPSLDLGRTGTLEAWIKVDTRNAWHAVIAKGSSSSDASHNYAMEVGTNNKVNCVIGNGSTSHLVESATALQAARFYHVACSWDGTSFKLYLDGALSKTVTQTITPLANAAALLIGQYGGNGDAFDGVIDEVRVLNVALTQAEIQTDMNTAVEANPDVVPPTVAMVSPVEGVSLTGTVAIVASAADDRVVAGVRFLLDGAQIGVEDTSDPYTITWDTTTAVNGTHTLAAVARDATGNTTTSASRSVSVANPPHLVITQPSMSAVISGSSLAITYTIVGDQAAFAVNHVHFQLDGGPERMDLTPADGTYAMNNVAPGAHTLTGFLVRSDHTKIPGTDSLPVPFTMKVPDTILPTVTMTNPLEGGNVSGSVTLAASASDDVGIAGVSFSIDGFTVGNEDTTSPYSVAWQAVGSGAHVVTATARDLSNNTKTSDPVNFRTTDPSDPSVIGSWAALMDWPLVAVHATLMPTNEILMWDGWELPDAAAKVWNPATDTFYSVPVGAGVFCSSQTLLSDGRVLVTGGHQAGGEIGIPDTFIFTPATRTWTRGPYMSFSRWYPSSTRLSDGRVVTLSGQLVTGSWADTPEIFNPDTNTWAKLTSAKSTTMHDTEYPLTFLLPDSRIYVVSALLGQTYALNPSPQSWTSQGAAPFKNGTAAMYRPGKILMTGGGAANGASKVNSSTVDTATGTTWQTGTPMAYGRYQHNLVVLADGDVLAVGGATTVSTSATVGTLPAELWDVDSKTWTTMASMADPRMYHSIAMLMPDGRVLSAGGGRLGSIPSYPTAQMYSPPYLFRGPRPTISGTPASAVLGTTFSFTSPNASSISKVALVPLNAVTHTLNMNQTYVELSMSVSGNQVLATLPTNASILPPGYYMLFALNTMGVPAMAPFIRVVDVNQPGDTTNPTVSVSSPAAGQTLSGTLSVTVDAFDDQSVAGVQFQLDGQNLGAEDLTAPYAVSWNTALTPNGTHVLTAVARDAASNFATSTPVSVMVSNGSGSTAALGLTTVASQVDSGAANFINTWRFVMPAVTGLATSMSVYIAAPVSPSPNDRFQVAIYTDQAGKPGTLVTSTASQTIVPNAWNSVAIGATLQPNTYYWLAYNTNASTATGNNVRYDPGASGQMQWRAQTFGAWPATFGTPEGSSPSVASIFVTYQLP